MSKELDVEIFEPPSNRRYWVVKADAGKYYETFLDNSIIAIGHLNKFLINPSYSNPFISSSTELKRKMTIKRDKKSFYNSNNFGQVNSFVNEMKIGDWVITKTSNTICIGQITSDPRLDDEVIKHTINKETPYERTLIMDFLLRRDVCWGPKVKMNHLPTDIYISLRSPMTLYNIDRHMESICYTLYPFFKIDDSLYFSIRINQDDDIPNYYLTKVLEYLNELDFLSHIDLENEDLTEIYQSYIDEGLFSLSTQASFHSPGDIWAKVLFPKGEPKTNMAKAIIIYSMLFGNSHLGIDGILDLESRQKLWGVLVERIDMDAMKNTVEQLDLTMPKYNTEKIEKIEKANIQVTKA